MPVVTIIQSGGQIIKIDAQSGESILKIALDHGIDIEHACGGNGFCTTCLCKVKDGAANLSVRNDREENMGITEHDQRLSCQTLVQGDVTVEIQDY